jgi:hypothetical protein
LLRLSLIWIIITFTGCATPLPLSDSTHIEETVPKPKPRVYKIDPTLRLSIERQIYWQSKLQRMSPAELWKTRQALLDGMFSDPETLESEGRLYPRPKRSNEI